MRSMLKIAKTGYLVLSALLLLAGVGLTFFSDTFYPILTVLLGVLFLVLYFGGSLLCRAPELPELFSVMRRGKHSA